MGLVMVRGQVYRERVWVPVARCGEESCARTRGSRGLPVSHFYREKGGDACSGVRSSGADLADGTT